MAKFTEDDALEAIEGNKEADEFESKYPNCVINVGKLSPKKSLEGLIAAIIAGE